MFFKLGVLKDFVNFTGKHLCWSLFFLREKNWTWMQMQFSPSLTKTSEHLVYVQFTPCVYGVNVIIDNIWQLILSNIYHVSGKVSEWHWVNFHLIYWCVHFVERQSFGIVSSESPETIRKFWHGICMQYVEIVLHSIRP